MTTPEQDMAKDFDERHHVSACVNALATLLEAVKGKPELASRLTIVLLWAGKHGVIDPTNDLAELFEKKD